MRAVNRSGRASVPPGVEMVAADLSDAAQAREACAGATVVYNCINVAYHQWEALFPPLLERTIAATAAAGARMVFADNLYLYGPVSEPMTESLPPAATTRKRRVRAQMAARLRAAHERGELPVVVGRVADFYGPKVTNSAGGADVMRAVLAGKKAMWVGSLDAPHTMTFIDDFARGLLRLGSAEATLGQVWHIPAAEPLTGASFSPSPLRWRASSRRSAATGV